MFQSTRKEKIMDLLEEKKEYKIDDLCKYFKISLSTIYRDLNDLEREGRVKKVHGGVILNIVEDIETRNTIRSRTNVDLKKKIAIKALEFVENEDCLFLDNSTTCYYFARELSESKFKNIMIVTNSNLIPDLFLNNEDIQIVSTGGIQLKFLNCFVGPSAINTINEFNGNKFFLSTAAISINGGLSDAYHAESEAVKRKMIERSQECICLVDSSKFNKTGQRVFTTISTVDKIITDSGCPKETREEFLQEGKKLIIA